MLQNESGFVSRTADRALRAGGGGARRHNDAAAAGAPDEDRARLVAALTTETVRFRTAIEHISLGLCMFDADMRLLVSNRRYAEIYGVDPAQIRPGMTMREIIALRAAVGSVTSMTEDEYIDWWKAHGETSARTVTGAVFQLRNGRYVALRHRAMAEGGFVTTHEDVTERRQMELRLAHMAHHDSLTGLPNRVKLREQLEQALTRLDTGRHCAVICIDLDRFKEVNDTLGHPIGDGLLQAVTGRLRRHLPRIDILARLGGDEFAIVQSSTDQPDDAVLLAARLIRDLSQPYGIDGHRVIVGASVGIASAPRDGSDPDLLLRNADLALYRAKAEGRGRFRVFEPRMDEEAQRRRTLELDLRRAISERQLALVYQPLVNMQSGRITGFEALLRWQHPERGCIAPADFIPIAEETGLIVPIGEWVLHNACAEAATWPEPLKVAVNLSGIQFRSAGRFDVVAAALRSAGLAPQRLELEVTESAMIQDWDDAVAVLERIKRLGVQVSMDDFGTGYSSLSYLRRFPFDKVKIDQYFIHELSRGTESRTIIRAIVDLCRALGIATTAEGVETEEQLAVVGAEHCTEAQGYLLIRPVPPGALPALLARAGTLLPPTAEAVAPA
jgi:diguanylate cyclase (GGDEF)-like protein/PAS domain S-box-containing protein